MRLHISPTCLDICGEYAEHLLFYIFFKFIARLAVVRWLCSFVFVILVCNIQPSSSGQLEVREGGSLSIGKLPTRATFHRPAALSISLRRELWT